MRLRSSDSPIPWVVEKRRLAWADVKLGTTQALEAPKPSMVWFVWFQSIVEGVSRDSSGSSRSSARRTRGPGTECRLGKKRNMDNLPQDRESCQPNGQQLPPQAATGAILE